MNETVPFDATPEARRAPPHAKQRYDPSVDRNNDRQKRNLETLLWLGMEIDGSATQGKAKRNRPLQFSGCRGDGRK